MVWENTTLGPRGYSPALATCNLEGVFTALGLARAVPGERGGPRARPAPGREGGELGRAGRPPPDGGRSAVAAPTLVAVRALRGRDIVCFSNDWDGDPLSKTHIMRILSRDNRVLWVNSIGNRGPRPTAADAARIGRS